MNPASKVAKRISIGIVAVVAAFYVVVFVYFRWNETDLVFAREAAPNGYPAPADSLHLPYRTVTFRTADSVVLASWVVPAEHKDSSGMWVLLAHGQTGNLATTTRPQYYAYLRTVGVNILAFDWRGFGVNGGVPSEAGLYRDATAAYDYLRNELHVPADHIIIFGHSMGTAPAIELATRVQAAGLIIEGAPTSIRDRAQELYPWLPMRLIARTDFNSLGRIDRVTMPILVMHARADARVPISHGRAPFAAATAKKSFVDLDREHHTAFLDSARYFGAYRRFVDAVRPRK